MKYNIGDLFCMHGTTLAIFYICESKMNVNNRRYYLSKYLIPATYSPVWNSEQQLNDIVEHTKYAVTKYFPVKR